MRLYESARSFGGAQIHRFRVKVQHHAVVIDLSSRPVICWSTQGCTDDDLQLQALLMAVWRRKPETKVNVHSDPGSQFTNSEWQPFLEQQQKRQCVWETKGLFMRHIGVARHRDGPNYKNPHDCWRCWASKDGVGGQDTSKNRQTISQRDACRPLTDQQCSTSKPHDRMGALLG